MPDEISDCTENNVGVTVVNDKNTKISENVENQGAVEVESVPSEPIISERIDGKGIEDITEDENAHSILQDESVSDSSEHQESVIVEDSSTFE